MDEDVADGAPGGAGGNPATATHRVGFVMAFPGEFGAGCSVTAAIADIEPSLEGTEDNFTLAAALESDVGAFDEVEVVVGTIVLFDDTSAALESRRKGVRLIMHGLTKEPEAMSASRALRYRTRMIDKVKATSGASIP